MSEAALEHIALKCDHDWEIETRYLHRGGWYYDHRIVCMRCKESSFKGFMVKNEVWQAAGFETRKGWICRDCFEKRLGRALTLDDLIQCPFNDWLELELLGIK